MSRLAPRTQQGQSTIEVVGMVPMVLVACLILVQALLLAGFALHADRAAHAAAIADAGGRPAARAARTAIPGWARGKVSVNTSARTLRVTLRPKSLIPGLDRLIATRAQFERREW